MVLAENGQQALDRMEESCHGAFAIVIMDVQMTFYRQRRNNCEEISNALAQGDIK